jgi:hypothetical protein
MHRKGWSLLLMEGAQTHHVRAGLTKLNVIAYDFDYIGSCANIFNLAHGLSAIADAAPHPICLMSMAMFPKSGLTLDA